MAVPKLRRWIDLLAALLRRHYPVPFEEIIGEVPAYQSGTKAARRRMFERDKDELRAAGIPIQTVSDAAGEVLGYKLSRREFYLPYLSLIVDGQPRRPKTVDRDGFRGLEHLAFEPDELAAIVHAADRVESLANPLLSADAKSAVRKLAADLPVDAARTPAEVVAPGRPGAPAEVFDIVSDALERRKRLMIDYRTMSTDTTARRAVEPYGLFFLGHHWYLAARDPDADAVRNFRVSRIGRAEVNPKLPARPDFEVPAGFRLRDHARSRQAWELGDGGAATVEVEFRRDTGAAAAAAGLGARVDGASHRRTFQVRRADAFVRWLLPLGDAAVILAPEAAREEYARQARATLEIYEAKP
jgi:proteasome accessory factor B